MVNTHAERKRTEEVGAVLEGPGTPMSTYENTRARLKEWVVGDGENIPERWGSPRKESKENFISRDATTSTKPRTLWDLAWSCACAVLIISPWS